MFDESTFLAWVLQCPLSACDVLAVDMGSQSVPAGWHLAPEKGRKYDLIVIGRPADGREVARLMKRLKLGGSHLRMLGQCPMPPPGCATKTTPFPGAGLFTMIWKPRN